MYSHKALKLSSHVSAFCSLSFFLQHPLNVLSVEHDFKVFDRVQCLQTGSRLFFRFDLTRMDLDWWTCLLLTIKTTKLKS